MRSNGVEPVCINVPPPCTVEKCSGAVHETIPRRGLGKILDLIVPKVQSVCPLSGPGLDQPKS
jgi:hypothetical protein